RCALASRSRRAAVAFVKLIAAALRPRRKFVAERHPDREKPVCGRLDGALSVRVAPSLTAWLSSGLGPHRAGWCHAPVRARRRGCPGGSRVGSLPAGGLWGRPGGGGGDRRR